MSAGADVSLTRCQPSTRGRSRARNGDGAIPLDRVLTPGGLTILLLSPYPPAMPSLRVDCTIVDLLVRNSSGRLAPDPSGWTPERVRARVADANAVWAQAGIRFDITTITSNPFRCENESDRVDRTAFFMLATHIHGASFQKGRVSIAFIKRFASEDTGGESVFDNAYTALAYPRYDTQSRWTLAHELGHLLGLNDESSSGSIMYGGLPSSGRIRPDQVARALRCRHFA